MAVFVSLLYFYTVMVIEKKNEIYHRGHENTPFWP